MLKRQKRNYKALAIIGNGFDLAHNYKTNYSDFVERTDDEILDIFKSLCSEEKINTWYEFENNIKTISFDLYQQNFTDSADYDKISEKTAKLNKIFLYIHTLLKDYLENETKRKIDYKIPSIKKYIDSKTIAINFNYTDVAKAYTKDIFYIHGSIDESSIILGYDNRNEPCLITMEYMQWYKKFRRELLAFKRYLKYEKHIKEDCSRYKILIDNFVKYQFHANSGRGIDDEIKSEIKKFRFIDNFIRSKCKKRIVPNIKYKNISTILIIGHGIESDEEFLKEILNKCTKAEKIIIFRYSKEDEKTFQKKMDFFKPFCNNICIENYSE